MFGVRRKCAGTFLRADAASFSTGPDGGESDSRPRDDQSVHCDLKPDQITTVEKWLLDFRVPTEKVSEVFCILPGATVFPVPIGPRTASTDGLARPSLTAKKVVDELGGFGAAITGLHIATGALEVATDHWVDQDLLDRLTELLLRP